MNKRNRNGSIRLVAGNSNPRLAEAIGAYLETPLARAVVRRFADMEIFVESRRTSAAPTFSCSSRRRIRPTIT